MKTPKHDITPGDWPQTENIIHEIDIEISEIKSQITSNISGISAAIESQLSAATDDLSSELSAVSQHVISVDSQLLLIESEAASNDSEILLLESEVSNASARITAVSEALDSLAWQNPVIDRTVTPPVSPSTGDRYLITGGIGADWIGLDASMIYSVCGEETGHTLSIALDVLGQDWEHNQDHTHQFILDLGQAYTITQFRIRSNTLDDPTDVDIYVSNDVDSFGTAVATGITTWQDRANWAFVTPTEKTGRYIKVVINDTEDGSNYIGLGFEGSPLSAVFDVYGAGGGTGVWEGHDDDIAVYDGTQWLFYTPIDGSTVYVQDENCFYVFDGATWNKESIDALQSQMLLVESEAASNDSEILILESEASNNSVRITSIDSQLLLIESEVSSNDVDIASIGSIHAATRSELQLVSATGGGGDISTVSQALSQTISDLLIEKSTVNDVSELVSQIDSQLLLLESEAASNDSEILLLESRVSVTEQSIASIGAVLLVVESEASNASARITAVDSQLLLIESEAASNDSEILLLESEASNNSTRITAVDSQLLLAESEISALTADHDGFVDRGDGSSFDLIFDKETGSATSTSANHLVDTAATFQTNGVAIGDVVNNTTDNTSATVTAVNSENDLTLDADIMTSGESYFVGSFDLDGTAHTVDLSSIIPANATAVIFRMNIQSSTANDFFRIKRSDYTNWLGAYIERIFASGVAQYPFKATSCNSARTFSYQVGVGAYPSFTILQLYIVGWWVK